MQLTIELQMLGWAMVLGLVQLLAASASMTAQRGTKWNASARDGDAKPLTGVAARLDRALRNYLETFPIFAAAVLAVSMAGRTSADTALAVQLYLWARVAYVPAYAVSAQCDLGGVVLGHRQAGACAVGSLRRRRLR